jgi:hypothetical protein
MARQIESLHDNLERVCFQFSQGIPDHKLGGQCALLKVQASKTFEVTTTSLLAHIFSIAAEKPLKSLGAPAW